MDGVFYGVVIVACLVGIILFFYFVPVGLWITALFSGVKVSIGQLIGMRLRKVPPSIVVNNLIKSTKAGLKISITEIETHFLAKGNINRVIDALISADKANIDLDFKLAAAIDLAGRDVYQAVHDSVTPRVVNSPPVAAVAKDGIQLIAKSRITLRADIHRLVGGAGEETILARVGEGIVTTIGSANNHKDVLENPDLISKKVLEKGLDSGTAFSILSIDIADIDIGENVGAKLQTDQAEADLKVARAKAEERRAMAVATEQEFTARAQEMRAKVIEAEAMIPLAMAEAFRSGNLGVMDYYKLRNIEADTDMRDSISNMGKDDK
ncbi:MAG: flotillin-like protein FloA [Bacteroidia bacterium]|nr:flotillin-like protein FloA [Bacteroidia bacterium]